METADWWRHGVLYQIYPRSYADADGDGIGDLAGIRSKLEHLEWLGIDGIWLNPTMPSPNDDWGYDVADYTAVHPDLGTLEELDGLIADAAARGIRVLLDLVPNHTSAAHPWFVDARSSPQAEHRDFYVWADPKPDGGPPSNWLGAFGGSAWTLDEPSGQYYLHNFLPSQPDLNWWNPAVSQAFDEILAFWFARGVAGFRLDVAHAIVKDRELRDDPVATPADHPKIQEHGVHQIHSMNRPEGHDVLRHWREVADAQDPPRILVGETYVLDLAQLVPFYGSGVDELHLAFNFLFIHSELQAEPLRAIVEALERDLPDGAWPVWTGSNHDAGRLATRWAQGDERKIRVALLTLLTLRGTPFLGYGDEIGLQDGEVSPEQARDPVGARTGDPSRGRDGCRTPMPWTDKPGAGFTPPWATPWLPLDPPKLGSVAQQRGDVDSVLHLTRALVALRRKAADLHLGAYATLPAPEGAWAYARGDGLVVALNLSDERVDVALPAGRILLASDGRREGDEAHDGLALKPWTGVVLRRRP